MLFISIVKCKDTLLPVQQAHRATISGVVVQVTLRKAKGEELLSSQVLVFSNGATLAHHPLMRFSRTAHPVDSYKPLLNLRASHENCRDYIAKFEKSQVRHE